MPCGGKGRCGKCKVLFKEGAPSPTPTETAVLTETELAQGYRLACQTILDGDAVVYLHDHKIAQGEKILATGVTRAVPLNPWVTKRFARVPEPSSGDLRSDMDRVNEVLGVSPHGGNVHLEHVRSIPGILREAEFRITGVFAGPELVTIEPGDTSSECFGVAFDIGTTTLAGYLVDLNTGTQVGVASAVNPQTRVGDDVISRINYVGEHLDGLKHLQSLVVSEMNRLVARMVRQANIRPENIYESVVVGNTCMTHLLLGVDPRNLALAPYVPVFSQSLTVEAAEIGLKINNSGQVHILPNIAGYVGADTVGTILASSIHEDDSIVLAVDIGTNGEIVLGSRNLLLACSTAAGPAFEGAHITHGMRAAPGAIDRVWVENGDIRFTTVGNHRPTGICGSGLLDAIACLLEVGIIHPGGRILDSSEVPQNHARLKNRLVNGGFVLSSAEQSAHGVPIAITQRDIREVQLAKGAIAAGIRTLMEYLKVRVDDLSAVVLAGAFGNYMRKRSAIAAGLIPDVPVSKVRSVGNAAGEGAKLALISSEERRVAEEIARFVQYIELTTDPGFQDRFAESLAFGSWPGSGSS